LGSCADVQPGPVGTGGTGGTGDTAGTAGTGGTAGTAGTGGTAGTAGTGGTPVGDCATDMFLESNDSFADPGPFPLTGSVHVDCVQDVGCSGPDWRDVFPLIVNQDVTANFVLSWTGESDLDLYLVDSQCEVLAASNGEGNPESINMSFSAGDDFAVEVSGWITNESPQDYTVTAE